MRTSLTFLAAATLLLWNSCAKDLSCYRDMIVGTWVEQTFDGQIPETNQRGVHIFNYSGQHTIKQMVLPQNGVKVIGNFEMQYLITCKIITSSGLFSREGIDAVLYTDFEVLHFTDSTLRIRVVEEIFNGQVVTPAVTEITYKKVSAENPNKQTIQQLWELTGCSEPDVPPFQIKFGADGTYALYLFAGDEASEEGAMWIEKGDEEGLYGVYDSFLMTQFFNNPIFGASDQSDVACWELLFAEEDTEMTWQAVAYRGSERITRNFTFTLVTEE